MIGVGLLVLCIIFSVLGWWWSRTPDRFDVVASTAQRAEAAGVSVVVGSVITSAALTVAETLLQKPGGYLSNDLLPPGLLLDNMPNWEFGVLVQLRDVSRAFRNDMSRSQSQSLEDPDLAIADPQFSFDNSSWLFPATESEYHKGIEALQRYFERLADSDDADAQFFARADNLAAWLALVEKRLGGLSQQLSASVGQKRINTDLAGDSAAKQSTGKPAEMLVKTPWLQLDDVFYEARGAAWALAHLLRAAQVDFQQVLEKKNAVISMRQIVRELDATQDPLWSPIILNGSGFGLWANHSLIMASYISRANAAVIDLRNLLEEG